MTTERIVAELVLDDGKYTVRMRGASREAKAFKNAVDRLDRSMKKTERTTRSASMSLAKWSVIIGQSRNVLHQLWFVTGQWMSSMVRTSAQVEKMTFLMKGMSTAANEVGKAAEAAQNVETLFDMAKNAPFTVNALSDSFVKFKSVGLDPLDGSMKSLVDATAAFGGTDETLHRASIAIQQMAGKGVISMEELRQQLGEAVPQAITIMAQSLGTTYGDLVDKISKGQVQAEPALKAMFTGFEIAFGGRAQALMDSFDGRMARFKTSWTELVAQNEGITEFFQSVKDGVSSLTDFLDTRLASDLMTGLGNGLAWLGRGFSTAIYQADFFYSDIVALIELMKEGSQKEGTFLNSVSEMLDEVLSKLDRFNEWAAQQNPESSFPMYAEAFKQIINGIPLLNKVLGESGKELRASMMEGFIGEDAESAKLAMIKTKLIKGLALTPEEINLYDKSYQQLQDRMNETTANIEDAKNRLNQAVERNAVYTALEGEEIFSAEQVEKIEAERAAKAEKLRNIEEELRLAEVKLNEQRLAHTTAAGTFDKWRFDQVTGEIQTRRTELEKERAALVRDINALRAINTQPRRMSAKESEVNGSLGDPAAEERLANLAQSVIPAISAAAQEVERLRQSWADMLRDAGDMSEGFDKAVEDVADNMAKTWSEKISEFQREQNTAGSAALAEAQAEMTDETIGDAEERYQSASETLNEYFDNQAEGLKAIGAAAIETLEAQGVAGIAAAQLVAAEIQLILSQIDQTRAAILKSIKGPTLISGSGSSGGGGKSKSQRALEKLTEMIEEAQEKGDELQRRIVDPFAYELPRAIESARKKINKLAADMSGGQWTTEMKRAFDLIATNEMTEEMLDMADATREIVRAQKGERQARLETFNEEVSRLGKMKARLIEMGIWRVEWEKVIQDQIAALREQMEAESPWGEFQNQWKDYFDNMESWATDAIGSVSQALADMVTEGEGNFADLARAALNSFLEIQFAALMSGVSDLIGGALKNGIGSLGGQLKAQISHSGDIVGAGSRSRAVDAAAFMGAQRYHTGGVIGQEVPAILEKGEGVFTAAQMKALGRSSSGPQEAKVNLINNTGQPMEAEDTSVTFTADGMIMDVVLKGMSRPGSFRDNMMRMMKK